MTESAPRARTPSPTDQLQMIRCAWPGCGILFTPRNPVQRFHADRCRAAYSREVGIVGVTVSVRRLKTRVSVTLHTADEHVLDAPLGTRFRLVREP